MVGIAFLVLCATQPLAAALLIPIYHPQNISLDKKKQTLFQMLVFKLTLLEDAREKTGSYCFHELYAYQWKLRNKEV